jgi:pilus assembly protein CpaB
LRNVRVLAIDQTVQEKDGQKVVVGKTATLELTPYQAETLVMSRQRGTLSLALRALTENKATPKPETDEERRSGTVNFVRYGVNSVQTIK